MRVAILERIRECNRCGDYEWDKICTRHQTALSILLNPHFYHFQNHENLFLYYNEDNFLSDYIVVWRTKKGRYQVDVISTTVCYSYRTVGYPESLQSTGDILLERFASDDPYTVAMHLEKLIPLPFGKISVSGYRDPHSDYDETVLGPPQEEAEQIQTWKDLWTVKIDINGQTMPVFVRGLYGEYEGKLAKGFFMHIPGRGIFCSLTPELDK